MLADIFLQSVLKRFREYKTLGEKTFAQLEENEMLLSITNTFLPCFTSSRLRSVPQIPCPMIR